MRDVAGQFGISKSGVNRHAVNCIRDAMTEAYAKRAENTSANVLDVVKAYRAQTDRILQTAKSPETQLKAIQRGAELAKLEATVAGAIAQAEAMAQRTVSALDDPSFLLAMRDIAAAVSPCARCREAMLLVLTSHGLAGEGPTPEAVS